MAKVKPKTKPVKKSVQKTKAAPSPKKKSPKKSAVWNNLAKELKSLIPKLDEEGLAFLVKQSHVHIYNMQVNVINKKLIKEEQRNKASPAVKKAAAGGFSEVKMSASGSSYYIIYNNEWIAFAKNEMTALVKIALGEGTELEVRDRLFNWLFRERSDLLYSASIADKFDDKLKSLILLLKDNFKIKNK